MKGIDTASCFWLTINLIRYRGYYWDYETGYYWLQTRYYNPQWRRFLNADNRFIAGEDVNDLLTASNMYAYCNGNPVMFVDPDGTSVIATILGLISDLFAMFLNRLFWRQLPTSDFEFVGTGLEIIGLVFVWTGAASPAGTMAGKAFAHRVFGTREC